MPSDSRNDWFEELKLANAQLYAKLNLDLNNFKIQKESREYHAATFNLDDRKITYRTSKITPTKVGQFVTCWKRNSLGITVPFHQNDAFDFLIISCRNEGKFAQFIFSKSCLIEHAIVSNPNKKGKRGFRLYPIWDCPTNKQAVKTQKWQLPNFVQIHPTIEVNQFSHLFEPKPNIHSS
ncbi:MepB family protein [Sphingobacterium hungaricum]|uniref:MepB family protein n=1 Tax=Sphingobacterium hungaricum TaxID=2082723 RepID=A0A928V1B7_9SPHI|nr:MepB family protein [Sphingobacterium hungaricum]MBE8715176.1 MepB family protein [Sphingobacterium hungaricum]